MSSGREKDLFLQALDIEDSAERKAFLNSACEGDENLREEVGKLLGALDETPDRFEPETYSTLGQERASVRSLLSSETRFLDQLGQAGGEIGQYELLEEIGRGAMGIVFRARQPELDREVALKVVLNAGLASPGDRERFRFEAAAAARLEHPNIVPVYEVGISQDHHFYSMLLVEGGTLAERIKNGPAKNSREAVALIMKVVDAVESAHEHGIIHRDLKPENILLTREGEPLVSDFGLARLVEAEDGLTLSGQILGTPRYMAPEMTGDAEAASTRSDIYALGAVLYEMLVGEPLFEGGSILTTLRMVQEQEPVRPRTKVPDLDRDLETIVLKCLEKSPGNRYVSARSLFLDLEAWLHHRPIAARPAGPFERTLKWMRRRPGHAALAGLATLVVLSLGIGGPFFAIHQRSLRESAEQASREADTARESAELATAQARQQAEINRRLAYSANQRYIQLSHELQGESSLASEMMITGWIPEGDERDLRGWEWFFNYARIYSDEKIFRLGGPVASLDFSPDGEMVAASGPRGTEIRNNLSGALVRQLNENKGHRKSLWSPSGDLIVTVNNEGKVGLWNPATGGNRPLFESLPEVIDLDWKGDRLLTLHADAIRCWRFDGREAPASEGSVAAGESSWRDIELSPGGRHFAAAGSTPVLFIWDCEVLEEPLLKLPGAASRLVALDWKPDGRWIAASTEKNAIRIWEVPGGQRIGRIGFKEDGPIRDIAWNAAGDQIALLNPFRGQLDVFDLVASRGKPTRGFSEGETSRTLAWSPEGSTIAVGLDSGVVALVRRGLPKAERAVFSHDNEILSFEWAPDGNSLVCLCSDKRIFQINTIAEKAAELPKPGESFPLRPSSWSPGGAVLAIAQGDVIDVVEARSGKRQVSIQADIPEVVSMVWLNDRDFLVCGEGGEIAIVRSGSPTSEVAFAPPEGSPGSTYRVFSVSPDGHYLLGTGAGQRLTLWETESGNRVFDHNPEKGGRSGTCHAWEPDGGRFAIGNEDGVLGFWKPGDRNPVKQLRAHRGTIHSLAWHPRGNRLASGGKYGMIRIWDPDTGEMLLNLKEHAGPVLALAWDSDGRRLASCGADGTVRIWDASAGMLLSAE